MRAFIEGTFGKASRYPAPMGPSCKTSGRQMQPIFLSQVCPAETATKKDKPQQNMTWRIVQTCRHHNNPQVFRAQRKPMWDMPVFGRGATAGCRAITFVVVAITKKRTTPGDTLGRQRVVRIPISGRAGMTV